jgi:AraC-like DNA-binding protein
MTMDYPGLRLELDLRPFGLPCVPLLGLHEHADAGARLPAHRHHQAMEICLLARGRQEFRVNGCTYHLRGGDVFVTFPDEVHDTGDAPIERGKLYWLILLLPRAATSFHLGGKRTALLLHQGLSALPNRHFRASEGLSADFAALIEHARAPADPLATARAEGRLISLLLAVLDCARENAVPLISAPIKRVTALIEKDRGGRLSIEHMADRAGLSVARFKRRFCDEVGVPPAEYAMRHRLAEARRRLRGPEATMTRIAHDLGFCSSQHFAATFRRYFGQTPTDCAARQKLEAAPTVGRSAEIINA